MKNIFAADYYRSNFYAAGFWRGVGVDVAPFVPVLHYHTLEGPSKDVKILEGPDKTVHILQGPSKQVHVLAGSN